MHSGFLSPSQTASASTRLELADVTLIAATSVAVPQTVRAMALSLQQVQFSSAVFLSDQPLPAGTPKEIIWQQIAPLRSRTDYSHFMLQDLRHYVATSHMLCVQWDGYVLDARGWDPAFLDYDYIGAPWPHFGDGDDVGNGGFSLRSRRLLEACFALGIDDVPEDVAICRTYRSELERDFGIRFAPQALARRFAFERYAPAGGEFGFHGVFNLADLVDANTLVGLLDRMEPGLLNRREHRDLAKFALRHGRLGLANAIIRRMYNKDARRH